MNKKLALALIFASLFVACTKTETKKDEVVVKEVLAEKPETTMEASALASTELKVKAAVEETEDMTGVIAMVAGEKLTEEDLEFEMNSMPEQYKAYFETEEGKTQLIERIIQQKLIVKEAYEAGMNEDEDFVKDVKTYEERLLASKYITEKIFEKVEVSDEELMAKYEENKDLYKQDEQVNASHILITTEGLQGGELEAARIKAIEILNRALEGEDFSELATNFSEGPSGPYGGNLGWFGIGQMVEPFEKAAFEGKTGEVYPEIVETRFGFHVIKVEDKKEESYIPFEDVAEQLREETLNQMRLDGYNEAVEDLEMKYEVKLIEKESTEDETEKSTDNN